MATDPSILLLSLGPIPAACRTKLASDLRRTHRPRSLSKLSSSRSGKRLTSHARTSSNGRALARSPFGRRRRSGGGAAQILIRPCLERSSGAGGRLQTQLPPQSYILTSSLRCGGGGNSFCFSRQISPSFHPPDARHAQELRQQGAATNSGMEISE